MSSYLPPREILPIFNDFDYTYHLTETGEGITQDFADSRYYKLTGGAITGPMYLPSGTVGIPSLSFSDDTNTGLYLASADNLGISTNGIQRVNVGTATTDIANVLRLDYQGGSNQLAFQLADATFDLTHYTDANEDYFINHGEFAKKIYLQHASAGSITVRPSSTAITNVDLCVDVGDGVSAYNNLFQVNENFARSNVAHRFANGSESAPSIAFNNSNTTGLYRIGADNIGISCAGKNVMEVQQSSVDVISSQFVHKPLTVLNTTTDFAIQNGDGLSSYVDLLRVDETQADLNVPLNVVAGTVGSPSIQINDTNTGFYSNTSGEIDVSINGGNVRNTDADRTSFNQLMRAQNLGAEPLGGTYLAGDFVYNTVDNKLAYYNGTSWLNMDNSNPNW